MLVCPQHPSLSWKNLRASIKPSSPPACVKENFTRCQELMPTAKTQSMNNLALITSSTGSETDTSRQGQEYALGGAGMTKRQAPPSAS